MKLSASKEYEGYDPDIGTSVFYDVYCDGEKLSDCIYADDVDGVAICYKTDENGHYIITKEECLETETIKGDIKIKKQT